MMKYTQSSLGIQRNDGSFYHEKSRKEGYGSKFTVGYHLSNALNKEFQKKKRTVEKKILLPLG